MYIHEAFVLQQIYHYFPVNLVLREALFTECFIKYLEIGEIIPVSVSEYHLTFFGVVL